MTPGTTTVMHLVPKPLDKIETGLFLSLLWFFFLWISISISIHTFFFFMNRRSSRKKTRASFKYYEMLMLYYPLKFFCSFFVLSFIFPLVINLIFNYKYLTTFFSFSFLISQNLLKSFFWIFKIINSGKIQPKVKSAALIILSKQFISIVS